MIGRRRSAPASRACASRPPAREASILEELSQHLEDRRQDLIAGGIEADRAMELARAEFERADLLTPRLGALRQARWQARPVPGVAARRPLNGVWQDLRYTWRTTCGVFLWTVSR